MKRFLPLLLLIPVVCFAEDKHVFKGEIQRFDPSFDKLVAPDATIEVLAEGFKWSEGPTWFDGSVVFSDVPENTVYQWKEGDKAAKVFLQPSGSPEMKLEGFGEPGSNGLGTDADGNLVLCQHGYRRLARFAPGKDPKFVTIADKYDGKRFTSPNDLAFRKNGDVYFTDPPYGHLLRNESPTKEIPFNGIYRVTKAGEVSLMSKEVPWPNGIAFAPDEKTLYIAVSSPNTSHILAFDVKEDGSITNKRMFFDTTPMHEAKVVGSCDGLKTDKDGNVWATVPGGLMVLSSAGKKLGYIQTNEPTGNCCWGDDGSTLYITSNMFLIRVKTQTKGTWFPQG